MADAEPLRARCARGDFRTTVPFSVRPPQPLGRDIVSAISRMQERDRVAGRLPGIDCGACGAPTCLSFAEDVVLGSAEEAECVFVREAQLRERIAELTRGAELAAQAGAAEERA